MAESTTTRLALPRWSADSDTPNRSEFDAAFASLEAKAAGWLTGTLAARPAAAAANDSFVYEVSGDGTSSNNGRLFWSTGGDWIELARVTALDENLVFAKEGVLAITTGSSRFVWPYAVSVEGVRLVAGTPPTGSGITVDVNKMLAATPATVTTIFTTQANRPTVPAGNYAGSEAVPDVKSFAAGDMLRVDIDLVGSTTPGSDLTVVVRYRRA